MKLLRFTAYEKMHSKFQWIEGIDYAGRSDVGPGKVEKSRTSWHTGAFAFPSKSCCQVSHSKVAFETTA